MIEGIFKSPQLWAGLALLAQALFMGIYMSVVFRVKVLTKDREAIKKMMEGKAFKIAHSVQMNNSEWSPYFIICHFFLHLNRAGSLSSALLSVGSSVCFVLFKAFVFPGKPAPVSATVRYLSLFYLILVCSNVAV